MKYIISSIAGVVLGAFVAIPAAFAVDPAAGTATQFLGGGFAPRNAAALAITPIAQEIVRVAVAGATLSIVIGAALMVLGMGDEGKIAKGKTAITYAVVGLAVTIVAAGIVDFVNSAFTGLNASADPFVDAIAYAATAIVALFNGVLFIVILFAGYQMFLAHGSADEFGKAKKTLMWACAGAIALNLAKAIAMTVANML